MKKNKIRNLLLIILIMLIVFTVIVFSRIVMFREYNPFGFSQKNSQWISSDNKISFYVPEHGDIIGTINNTSGEEHDIVIYFYQGNDSRFEIWTAIYKNGKIEKSEYLGMFSGVFYLKNSFVATVEQSILFDEGEFFKFEKKHTGKTGDGSLS